MVCDNMTAPLFYPTTANVVCITDISIYVQMYISPALQRNSRAVKAGLLTEF